MAPGLHPSSFESSKFSHFFASPITIISSVILFGSWFASFFRAKLCVAGSIPAVIRTEDVAQLVEQRLEQRVKSPILYEIYENPDGSKITPFINFP